MATPPARPAPVGPKPSALLSLVRACHPEPTAAVTVMSVALAAASGRSASGVAAVGAAVLTGQLSVGWNNDWLDAARDRANRRLGKPLVAGAVPDRLVGLLALAALAACVPLSLLSGWRAGVAHLVAVALAWAYNARLKRTVWSWAPYAVSFALLITFVSLGRDGHPAPPWWAAAAAALLGVGAHFANVVPDLEDDAATGICGLPHRLGRSRCIAGATGLLLLASGVVAFGPGLSAWTVLGLAAAAVAVTVGVLADRAGHKELLFRSSLLVALIDVAMLISRGSRL